MKHITVLILSLLLYVGLPAQNLELGAFGGFSSYAGDLSPSELSPYLQTLRPAFGVFGRSNIHPNFSLRFGFNRLQLFGDDKFNNFEDRNLKFETSLNELYLTGEVNILNISLFRDRIGLIPYAYGGGSFFSFNPTAMAPSGQRVDLQPLGTEGQGQPGYEAPYDLNNWALIVGGGMKILINEQWTIGIELGPRRTFTDYLDDISGQQLVYGDVLQNGDLAAFLSNPLLDPEKTPLDYNYKRGGENIDWYLTGGITLSYAFGNGHASRKQGGGKNIKCYNF